MDAAQTAFGGDLDEPGWERERVSVALERSYGAFDDGRPVGFSAAYAFELTVPGGPLPTAGVTWVGVMPTHRRTGILRRFMEGLHRDARDAGEPLAALFASEPAIYGRFGYGVATHQIRARAESGKIAFRDDPGREGTVRLVDPEEAYRLFPPLYDRLRRERPGMLSRSEHWWREHRLRDYESARRSASKRHYAAVELDRDLAGYVLYRVAEEWDDGYPKGEVRVVEAFAETPRATREVWRYIASIDLTTTIDYHLMDTASPAFLMLRDPRALHLRVDDGLWLRILDVAAALRARSYAGEGSVVLEVQDELEPTNTARYRAGADAGRTDDEPELALDVADLASAYLGAFSFERLRRAGRVEEFADGAVARASALFATPLAPYCPEVF